MDRFVTRTPTWKTLNYSSIVAKCSQQKSLAKDIAVDNKRPLRLKQTDEVDPHSYNCDKGTGKLFPFSHPTNGDHFNANSNDSGLSSASSVSPQLTDENEATTPKKLYTATKKQLTKVADYKDCQVDKENVKYMTITHTLKSHRKVAGPGQQQVQTTLEVKRTFNTEVKEPAIKALNKAPTMIMTRIQRDLNSPSASARMKAIKAMNSPTKSAYSHFDIPEVEQSLHLPDPPSLEEIMRNIVVYVEVRSGEDNRSAGVRKVIEALGARVSLSLNRETTHVVFKDGLLSTYKKAKIMNIPIVSILWIEACKNQHRICDPKDYPISNLDRYENPELYTKMKRVKSMQPDSECNKRRIRAKAGGTPKDSTPTQKTGNLKKTSTLIGGTPTSSTNDKKKTDISQFFKRLEGPKASSISKVDGDGMNGTPTIIESPATQLLNRIHSGSYTPLDELKTKTTINQNNKHIQNHYEDEIASKLQIDAKKALEFMVDNSPEINFEGNTKSNTIEASALPKPRGRPRRHSIVANCELETATHSLNSMAISFSTPNKTNKRRRSSIYTPKDMSVDTSCNVNNIETILEENNEGLKNPQKSQKPASRRRTLFTMKTMDQTELVKPDLNNDMKTSSAKSGRRRTLYTSKSMEEASYINDVSEKVPLNCEMAVNETGNDGLELANTSAAFKKTDVTPSRRSLYGVKTRSENNIAALKISSPIYATSNSICLTPTIFQKGAVASSTLLDDIDRSTSRSKSQSIATPIADATNGKLLEEETEQCTTPLVFSSVRQPGNKRRTLFDVSMDIITQRLQCINQSARRSLAPAMPSTDVVNAIEKNSGTPNAVKKSNNFPNCATPTTSTETLNECSASNDGIAEDTTPTPNGAKKKRKLFIPNEVLFTPSSGVDLAPADTTAKHTQESKKGGVSSMSNNSSARRRTLMPISQPQPTSATLKKDSSGPSAASTTAVRKRRSTMDFEQVQNYNTKAIKTASEPPSASAGTNCSQQQQPHKATPTPVLVYTNMHQQQIDVIREAIDKLGVFAVESCVSSTTTHLVSLEPRRTLNVLRALARGLWILDYSWIVESLRAGKWLPEEGHELQNFSRAIEICHSERQAFGHNYKCELFRQFGAFYISAHCSPLTKENMRELITLCGGQVVNVRQRARCIIGDAKRAMDDRLYLTPYWVLDSITQMQLMKINKYLYRLPDGRAASQPLPLSKKI